MTATLSIMRRELGAYFNTAMGYVIIVSFLLISGYFFTDGFLSRGLAEMRPLFERMPFLFLFFGPAIAMRLWSEERKQGTIEFLLTLPLTTWNAVLGKFLASSVFLVVLLALTAPIPIFLGIYGNPDWGTVIGGYGFNPDNVMEGWVVDMKKLWVCHAPPGQPESARTLGIELGEPTDAQRDFSARWSIA